MLYCNTATVATTRRAGTGLGAGRAARRAERTGGCAWGARAGAAGSWERGRAGLRSRRRQARGARGRRGLSAGRVAGRRWARGAPAAWALGARPGIAGWPGLCTRCTPLGFQPGFFESVFFLSH